MTLDLQSEVHQANNDQNDYDHSSCNSYTRAYSLRFRYFVGRHCKNGKYILFIDYNDW